MELELFIDGEPAPQGSKTGRVVNGKVVMWESSKKVKPWRKQVEQQMRSTKEQEQWKTTSEPISLRIVFYLAKPKTAKRPYPSVKPDLDKLIRSTMDGITSAEIWKDDSQVIEIHAEKHYGSRTGAMIVLEILS